MHSKVSCAFFTQSEGIQHGRKHESEYHTDKNNNANDNYWSPTCYSYATGEPAKQSLNSELCMRTEGQNERLKCYQYSIHYKTHNEHIPNWSLATNTQKAKNKKKVEQSPPKRKKG